MISSIRLIFIYLAIGVFFFTCENTPEGIQTALFDDTDVTEQELELSFALKNDVNNLLDITKAQNDIANWSERIYFDATILNGLEESISNVQLSIIGVDNSSLITNWNTKELSYGSLSPFNSAVPDTYFCYFCDTQYEVYLGHTWILTSFSGSGIKTVSINLRITYDYQGSFFTQDLTHDLTIFP